MKKVIVGILLGALAMYAWQRARQPQDSPGGVPAPAGAEGYTVERPEGASAPASQFTCDGRTYCSQMTSCEEAMFFLRNCPGVKMDGEGDGIPCEKQWCGQRR